MSGGQRQTNSSAVMFDAAYAPSRSFDGGAPWRDSGHIEPRRNEVVPIGSAGPLMINAARAAILPRADGPDAVGSQADGEWKADRQARDATLIARDRLLGDDDAEIERSASVERDDTIKWLHQPSARDH
jgi:hypothetical protein